MLLDVAIETPHTENLENIFEDNCKYMQIMKMLGMIRTN